MKRKVEAPESSRSFRVAVLVALIAAACAALQQGVGGPAARACVLIGYPVAFWIAYVTRRTRPMLLRIAVTGIAASVIVMFAASLPGMTLGGFASLQLPLAEVFIWMLLVHSMDSPGRRALLITLLSSAVLMAVAGVLSVSTAIVPFLVIWVIAAVTALVLGQRALMLRLPELAPPEQRRPHARLGTAAAIAVTLVVVAILGAATFMVAPVAGTSRSLTFPAELPRSDAVPVMGGLSNPSLGSSDPALQSQPGQKGTRASFGYFGFSNELDTATRGRPDNTLVMRVRAASPDYWRAQSFDTWDGRVWHASRTRPTVVRGNQPIALPRADDDGPPFGIVSTDELVQTYYVERPGPNAIFAAATPTKLYFSDRAVFQLPDGSLRAGVQLDEGSVYTVVSRRWLATAESLRSSDPTQIPQSIRVRYAEDPVITPRVRALAASVTADAPTTYDKIQALEAWMGAHTKYTLDIPPLPKGEDAVDRFLFVDHRGFCEQIGTSLVVMLRSLGIPARLAVGFASGERNPFTGLYEVRAKDAHAWAEVYFPGVGWQSFDPTAQVPLAGDSSIDGAGSGALAYLDARVDLPAWTPLAVAGLAALAVLAFLIHVTLRRRQVHRDRIEPSWAATRLGRLERLGAKRGRPRAPGETTPEYVQALARLDPLAEQHLVTIGNALDAAMFSASPPSPAACAAIDEAIADLAQRWRDGTKPEPPVLVRT